MKRPSAIPQAEDFRVEEAAIGAPGPGELLIRNLFLSVDPAQRGWASAAANYSDPVALGEVMRALAVGEVVESRADRFAAGDKVYGWFGWQEWSVVSPAQVVTRIDDRLAPLSAFAGPLGINGLTALLAFEELGRPVAGETLLVSTAAGAVGSIVGQLGRRAGCHVLGLAGGAGKAARCEERYGYHAAADYRAGDLDATIAALAPNGIDIYFDNVGGAMLDTVLRHMCPHGRIIQCGTASVAQWEPAPTGLRPEREVLTRRLSWNGFVIFDHQPRFPAAIASLAQMIRDGTLVYDEDIEDGIDAAPGALASLFAGRNAGKKLIRVGETWATS